MDEYPEINDHGVEDAFQFLAEVIAHDVVPVAPPAGVRAKLLTRIQEIKGHPTPAGYQISRDEETSWESMGVPGVRMRNLATEKGFRTFLVQFDAGASFPAHLHTGIEHCYVVWGDLVSGDVRLEKGDFQRAEQSTMHGDLHSERGCLLLITTTDPAEFAVH